MNLIRDVDSDLVKFTLVKGMVEFSEKTAKEIMMPRTDMACIFITNFRNSYIIKDLKE